MLLTVRLMEHALAGTRVQLVSMRAAGFQLVPRPEKVHNFLPVEGAAADARRTAIRAEALHAHLTSFFPTSLIVSPPDRPRKEWRTLMPHSSVNASSSHQCPELAAGLMSCTSFAASSARAGFEAQAGEWRMHMQAVSVQSLGFGATRGWHMFSISVGVVLRPTRY